MTDQERLAWAESELERLKGEERYGSKLVAMLVADDGSKSA